MRLVDQLTDVADRDPGFRAAGIAPTLDGFEDRFRLVAGERVTDVDHQQRRALAETAARAVAGRGEDRLVAFGQKLVPNRLGHGFLSIFLSLNYSGLLSTDRLRCDSRAPPRNRGGPRRRIRSASPIWRFSRSTSLGRSHAPVRRGRAEAACPPRNAPRGRRAPRRPRVSHWWCSRHRT